jgi:hypothetical protein
VGFARTDSDGEKESQTADIPPYLKTCVFYPPSCGGMIDEKPACQNHKNIAKQPNS